ncbi:MAG: nucleotidyl transferase AbiEii/AbiGii toxin family protein [Thermoplasmata archaeon]
MTVDIYETSRETVKGLIASGADIGVIGGWAVWAYNPYRYSMDIDVVVRPEDLWKVRKELRGLGFTETAGGHLRKKGFKKAVEGGTIEVDAYDGMIGPFRAVDVLKSSARKELFGHMTKVASPTDLLILKLHALTSRQESGKGQKDISDLIALLLVARGEIDLVKVRKAVPKKALKDNIALLTASYQQTARFYPLSMAEYKRLKAALQKWAL